MKNIIQGQVTDILDGNSFILAVSDKLFTKNDWGTDYLTVRIANSMLPAPTTLAGILAKLELEKKLGGQRVNCEIIEHKIHNQVIAHINVRESGKGLII